MGKPVCQQHQLTAAAAAVAAAAATAAVAAATVASGLIAVIGFYYRDGR